MIMMHILKYFLINYDLNTISLIITHLFITTTKEPTILKLINSNHILKMTYDYQDFYLSYQQVLYSSLLTIFSMDLYILNDNQLFTSLLFNKIKNETVNNSAIIRLSALNTLNNWMNICFKIIKNKLNKLIITCYDDIEQIINANWQHPYRNIFNVCKSLFVKYIKHYNVLLKQKDIADHQYWLDYLLPYITNNNQHKSRFFILSTLIPFISCTKLLQIRSNFINHLLTFIIYQPSILIIKTLEIFLLQLKHEMKKKSINQWRNLWLNDLIDIIGHCNKSDKGYLSFILNTFVDKLDSDCLIPILSQLYQKYGICTGYISLLHAAKKNHILMMK